MNQKQWELEQEHLQKFMIKYAGNWLAGARKSGIFENGSQTGRTVWEEADHVWERGDMDAAVEIKQYMDVLRQESRSYDIARRQLSKLERLENSPYFGRIDLQKTVTTTQKNLYRYYILL